MSATITRLPPVSAPSRIEEPVPAHVRHSADAVVARLNKTQHKDAVALHDALDRWIGEADRLGGQQGVAYLAGWSRRIEVNWTEFCEAAAADRDCRIKGLDGLTVGDFEAARHRIRKAVQALSGEAA